MKRYGRKLVTALTAVSLCSSLVMTVSADVLKGDADGNGVISAADLTALSSHMLNSGSLTKEKQSNADMNDDSKLNIIDFIMLKSTLTGTPGTPVANPDPVKITFEGNSIKAGKGVLVEGTRVNITASGIYEFSGAMTTDAQILIAVPETDTGSVDLKLDGVTMKNSDSTPCIMVENAEKTKITFTGTNSLSNTSDIAEDESAVIHAKDDITFTKNSTGTLDITTGSQLGISCNNDIRFNGGTISITTDSANTGTNKADAVKAKGTVSLNDGMLTIDSAGDGLKSSKDNVEITGGTLTVKAGNDAVQAETTLVISGGDVTACGDRGLRSEGTVAITGGTVLATATDEQCANMTSSDQACIVLDLTKEWSKNNPVALTDGSGKTVFEKNTLKKYRYAVISSPDLKSGAAYSVYAGGIEVKASSDIKAGAPTAYTDVNNNFKSSLLYSDLFDRSSVHRIEVEMKDWDNFLAHSQDEEYYPCDVVIDGERIENAGIRTKGHSSNMFVYQAGKDKYSFRIKFDKYDKYKNYKGLTEICLNNFYSDPSCMRDILCYDVMYDLDALAPKTSYTDMYLNGKLYSFYLLCEQPGTTLGERYATSDDAVLYKAADVGNSYDCTFRSSMKLNNFEVKFGTDDELKHIAELKDAINKVTSTNYKFIEDIIDVPSWLKGFAVNAVMGNYDSYNGQMAHNYYVEYTDGKMYYVGWDYNLSVGNFMDYGAAAESDITTGLYQADANQRPMLTNLLAVPEYREMYYSYVKQIVNYYSDPVKTINSHASLIRDHVKADPRFFFTADQFESNIAKSAGGLQIRNGGGNGGMWGGFGGGGFGGFGGGGFGGGGFFGGGLFSYGGDSVSIADFMIKRNEYIHSKLGF
ncbi:MAG: CotH kinase family protein [Oscillospiraceae bacterium]|nr:CotH kinase family protein [Oscillospiraceae bacterium]